ncbi:MAG: hypothetical protein LBS59_05135 [Puniceicoccales bacterium]|nr:hypothetical protein [Puniceicoccales bacterium]
MQTHKVSTIDEKGTSRTKKFLRKIKNARRTYFTPLAVSFFNAARAATRNRNSPLFAYSSNNALSFSPPSFPNTASEAIRNITGTDISPAHTRARPSAPASPASAATCSAVILSCHGIFSLFTIPIANSPNRLCENTPRFSAPPAIRDKVNNAVPEIVNRSSLVRSINSATISRRTPSSLSRRHKTSKNCIV